MIARGRFAAPGPLLLAGAMVLIGGAAELHAQCSMCRTLLATPEGARLAAALRSGIWILLAAPFTVFAVIAVAAVRKQRSRTHIAAALPPPPQLPD